MVFCKKNFCRLVGWTFKNILRSMTFCCHFAESWGSLHFKHQQYLYIERFARFHNFWLRYHDLISMYKYQSWFRVKPNVSQLRKSSAERRWFKMDSFWYNAVQRWSALSFSILNSAASEKIKADQLPKNVEPLMSFIFSESVLNSAEKCQISETALLSAEYLWSITPGVIQISWRLPWNILEKLMRIQRHEKIIINNWKWKKRHYKYME